MQRHIQQDLARKRKRNFILAAVAVILLIVVGVQLIRRISSSSEITAKALPISTNYDISPFGKNVLYYDGMTLHCVTTSGGVRWSVPLGSDAGFHTDGLSVVAWSNSQIYVLNNSGVSTHSDNLGNPIQFAKIGHDYVAIVVGEDTAPHLYIIDLNGNAIDQEINAYDGFLLLDIGFFGENGKYMWTLAFDVLGSVPDTVLATFQVGQKNTGNLSLGDALVKAVVHDKDYLKVITTRQMRTFDYRGSENLQAAALVYGWSLIDHYLSPKGSISMLFAPTPQTSAQYQIGELRLIANNTDSRYTLPSACIGASVVEKTIYAFADQYIYTADVGAQRFRALELPAALPAAPSDFLGMTTDKVALLGVGEQVYALQLP